MIKVAPLMEITLFHGTLTRNQKFAKFGPKTEMYSNFYEIWHLESEQIKHGGYKYNQYLLRIDYLDPRLQIQANLFPTLKFAPIFMKFRTQNKSNMLIMNITMEY